MTTGFGRVCNRIFASQRGSLSSKRIGGAILLISAIVKGFIIIAIWVLYKMDVPGAITQIIDAELIAGTTALGSTIFEKKYKSNE
jgi:NADH:ubiquinone oxidoreductase subunit 4 (subunit M)